MSFRNEVTAMATHAPLFIVMNAGSGDKDANSREAVIRDMLSRAGRPHSILRAGKAGELDALAREAAELALRQNGTVVAAGGDGTINTVVQAVLNRGVPLGILPQGTFNYFSRVHGIPVDPAEATEVLLKGVIRPVQVGMVNGRVFVVNGSLGLYPNLLERREEHKQKFGRTRVVALFSALTTFLQPPPQLVLTLEEDGKRQVMHVSTLLVENNPLQMQQVGLPEAESVRHGELAAVAVKARGILQMLQVAAKAALGRLGEEENVTTFTFTRLSVTPLRRKRVKVATDGEVTWLVAPLIFEVAPQPLFLVVPPGPEGRPR